MGGSGNLSGKTGVFLQARLGSTRLPGKALLQIEGKAIICHAMEALINIKTDVHVLLTDAASHSRLEPFAAACGFTLFTGSAFDVLNRFVSAAALFNVDTVIRATGDNPLVDAEAAELILSSHLSADADYSGFNDMPLGTGVEILKTSALIKAEKETADQYDHEHVSPYLYKNPGIFKINRISAPSRLCLPGSLVTVDTEDDLKYLKKLYRELYRGQPLEIEEIIPWLKINRRPE
jgi:spore coat polysaccharide biosynthesis protein SpsF